MVGEAVRNDSPESADEVQPSRSTESVPWDRERLTVSLKADAGQHFEHERAQILTAIGERGQRHQRVTDPTCERVRQPVLRGQIGRRGAHARDQAER